MVAHFPACLLTPSGFKLWISHGRIALPAISPLLRWKPLPFQFLLHLSPWALISLRRWWRGCDGYMVTNSSTKPTHQHPGWLTSVPTSYTFSSSTTSGTKTLYAWAKDAAGNVSTSKSASVTLSIGGTPILLFPLWATRLRPLRRRHAVFPSVTLQKTRAKESAAASTTKYYLSKTSSKTSSSVLLSGTRSIATLAAGKTSSGSVTVNVPVA